MSDDLKIDYVEFASPDIGASKDFFAAAFGWGFVDYGPAYQAFADAGLDGGIDGSGQVAPGAPLLILKAADLEAALAKVTAAGGEIVKPIFDFPGGRRFHFKEPGGNEMAVWSEA
jgi:predicted enzyme related to lactoylglutathione lyase